MLFHEDPCLNPPEKIYLYTIGFGVMCQYNLPFHPGEDISFVELLLHKKDMDMVMVKAIIIHTIARRKQNDYN